MTNEEINIAIAEACGWTNIRELDDIYPDGSVAEGVWWQGVPPVISDLSGEQLIPDYCNDLNAMHEAEKVLANQFMTIEEGYWRHLEHVQPHHIYATASQRAEAFLKTLNLWKA